MLLSGLCGSREDLDGDHLSPEGRMSDEMMLDLGRIVVLLAILVLLGVCR
jgi:hypothetical protein